MKPLLFASLILAAHTAASADMSATTADGRKVTLHDDGRWSFIESSADPDTSARASLALENTVDLAHGCRIGLRLNNRLAAQIRTLVLRFTAYKGSQIPFETVSRGFSDLKPTTSQYREVSFRGVGCTEINAVGVTAARNCHVGELTKYSASEEHCLDLVEVLPSARLPIAKQSAEP